MTNFDVIKAMTAEELAVTITCPNDMGMAEIPCDYSGGNNCAQCCLSWLNAEIAEEGS